MFPDHPLEPTRTAPGPISRCPAGAGLGVRADDLLDALHRARRGGGAEAQPRRIDDAELDATPPRRSRVGALRYYMLRFSRNRVVAFDLDDALAFEGETGPYLQYSVVRAAEHPGQGGRAPGSGAIARALAGGGRLEALPEDAGPSTGVSRSCCGVEPVLRQAVESLELSSVAKHAHVLAQAFNSFYHRWPVAQEEDEEARGSGRRSSGCISRG